MEFNSPAYLMPMGSQHHHSDMSLSLSLSAAAQLSAGLPESSPGIKSARKGRAVGGGDKPYACPESNCLKVGVVGCFTRNSCAFVMALVLTSCE